MGLVRLLLSNILFAAAIGSLFAGQLIQGPRVASSVTSMTSATIGQWSATTTCAGSPAVITTPLETITVPAGNSGSLNMHCNNNAATVQYILNAAAAVNLTNNADNIITVANGDTIKFRTTAGSGNCSANVGAIGPLTGTVKDNTTGATLDTFSVVW